jgi:hypothetical protein
MAASNTFGPDQPGELSAREKKILDGRPPGMARY